MSIRSVKAYGRPPRARVSSRCPYCWQYLLAKYLLGVLQTKLIVHCHWTFPEKNKLN